MPRRKLLNSGDYGHASPLGPARLNRLNRCAGSRTDSTNTYSSPARVRVHRRGQAAIEYVLLVAVVTLIFGAMFAAMRQGMFRLWVCDIAPRVQSPGGCNNDVNECWAKLNAAAGQRVGPPPECSK